MQHKLQTDAQVVKYRARLHHKLGQAERAVALLEAYLGQFPDAADLTHINMLAELFMEAGRCAPARLQGARACMPSRQSRAGMLHTLHAAIMATGKRCDL